MIGGIYRITQWIMRFSVINLLWILFNLPITYFIISMPYVEDKSQFWALLIIICISTPLFFFPATAAMFGVVRKWVMGDEDVPLILTYWKHYKENYLKSLLGGLIFVPLWIVWIVDYYYFYYLHSMFIGYFFMFGSIFIYVFTMYFFAGIVHFNLNLFGSLKNAFLLALGNPILTLILAISNGIIFYISFTMFTSIIVFFMGSILAYIMFSGYYRIILKLQQHADADHLTLL